MTAKKIYDPRRNDFWEWVFDCPDCKTELEDISDVVWSNLSIYQCPKCGKPFTLVEAKNEAERGIIRGFYTDS
jgi:Zn finger protein HypA/HybF involved in hydrogenase expression